jgi:multiple sugar transport system substrate-binding protein
MKDEWIGQFVKAGAVASLTKQVNAWSGKSTVLDSAWNSGKIPGSNEIYMLPHQNTALYMYYNKSLLQQAGVSVPRTQADVVAAAPKLTGNGHYAMDVRGGTGGQDQWAAWMYAGGAKFVDSSGKVTLDSPKAEKVNQMYLGLAKYAPPGSATALFAQVESNFLSGKTALLIHHVGSLAAVRKQFGDGVGVIPIPAADASKPSTLQTDSGNVVFAASKQQTLAWQWGKWLLGNAQMLEMSTSPQGQLPVTKKASQSSAFAKDEGDKVAIKASTTAQSWPQLNGTTNVVNATWAPTIQEAFAGQISSKKMLQTLAADLAK